MRINFFVFFLLACSFHVLKAEDYQINSTSAYDQTNPASAMDTQENIIIVWSSYRQDSNSGGIFAQRFNTYYEPVGTEFQVNSTTLGNQTAPDVAMDPNGNFVVVWHSPGLEDEDVFARRFNASGVPLGSQFQVNSNTAGSQTFPNVAAGPNGNFIVVWQSRLTLPQEQWNVCFQLYNSSGSPVGSEQQVNLLTDARYPDVAMEDDNEFTIVWMQDDAQHTYNQVMFRMYTSGASPKADSNSINTTAFYTVTYPSISCAASGHFVVTWEAHPSDASLKDIYARWYKFDGTPKSNEFVVNTYIPGAQQNPKVAMNDQRDFIIVWNSNMDIHAQKFDEFAHPIGDEFVVNTYTFSDQKYPAAVIKENREFAVVWQSDWQDGSGYGIFGKTGPQIPCADFTDDLFVNFRDYCALAKQWLTQGDFLTADLVNDNKIDYYDLDEFSSQWLTPCRDCTFADLNFDDMIDFKDFALLAGNWLKQGPNLAGDIDTNGSVNLTDLKILLSHWLELCE